ncbi:hypothetical protein LTR56_013088 [Elasticomyces elasticus]|nr:hypothetical protein LTR56_013088 [Elasticomyces elasticus]KAK3640267.1 hypothetical protein LTR22_017102 [Elasticomyces elasticus]KAK4920544.1 hypothetical protein LTR49_011959 [Elasticomyces elasticus]KAK5758956.1 hypothetical protein LTS12_010897 [Elasticomyces elasticus]
MFHLTIDTAMKETLTDSSAESKRVCGVCGAEPSAGDSLLRCTHCKSVWYCGKGCQQKDWELHKTACKKMASPRWPDGTAAMVELQPETRKAATRYPAVLLLLLHHPNAPNHDPTSLSNYACQEAFLKGGNLSDRNKFKELPLSSALGYPLVVSCNVGHGYGLAIPNTPIVFLSTDPDPVSPRFGLPTLDIPIGDLVLVRREVLSVPEREQSGEKVTGKRLRTGY